MSFGAYCAYHTFDAMQRLRALEIVIRRQRIVKEREAANARAYAEMEDSCPK